MKVQYSSSPARALVQTYSACHHQLRDRSSTPRTPVVCLYANGRQPLSLLFLGASSPFRRPLAETISSQSVNSRIYIAID
ncbi:MAG: hypothetical protein Q4A08_00545 [Bacteroidales bacterium]|nr:hypothetical protein [Bacteroidales bacterium]